MAMKSQPPSKAAVECREAILAAMQPFKNQLSGMEIVALLSYTLGQCIATQDQRVVTREMIWDLVGANIEEGNAMVIRELMEKSEGMA